MKPGKYSLMLLMVANGFAFQAWAEADVPPTEKPANAAAGTRTHVQRFKTIADQLELTGEQKEKLKTVIREQARQLRDLRQETGGLRGDRRQKLKELRESLNEKLKPILTKEQLEKWEKLRGEAGKKRQKQ